MWLEADRARAPVGDFPPRFTDRLVLPAFSVLDAAGAGALADGVAAIAAALA